MGLLKTARLERCGSFAAVALLGLSAPTAVAADSQVEKAVPGLRAFALSPVEVKSLFEYLDGEVLHAFPNDPMFRKQAVESVARNLADKAALAPVNGSPFTLTAEEIRHTVIDYEIFKLKTYLSAGVFPKRYFGYFDQKWDTASYEKTLREVTHGAVAVANQRLAITKSSVRISESRARWA